MAQFKNWLRGTIGLSYLCSLWSPGCAARSALYLETWLHSRPSSLSSWRALGRPAHLCLIPYQRARQRLSIAVPCAAEKSAFPLSPLPHRPPQPCRHTSSLMCFNMSQGRLVPQSGWKDRHLTSGCDYKHRNKSWGFVFCYSCLK